MSAAGMLEGISALAARFAADRPERQQRRRLDPADFGSVAETGFLLTGVPRDLGGLWDGTRESARTVCEALRALAHGDSSVALVAAMHPAVLSYWLTTPAVPPPDTSAWQEQRAEFFGAAADGAWWGTVTSEPGSGGDVARSRARARRDGGGYRISGQKHFGSGFGISSFMLTTAVPEGEERPDWFVLPVGRDRDGVEVIAEWDGHGMTATQSHAIRLDDAPAVRIAWPGHLDDVVRSAGPVVGSAFTAVVVGIVQAAVAAARERLEPRRAGLRAYEQVEWGQAQVEAWLVDQAYEGMLRAVEGGGPALGAVVRGKVAVAQLAETCLGRLCRVLGGGTFSRTSPFGCWFEDVRALGYLRPPWALAFDVLLEEPPGPDAG